MKKRTAPDLDWEIRVGFPQLTVVGVDEVGRGCLAGPVVAGAVALPDVVDFEAHPWLREVSDSKLLSLETRRKLAPLIRSWAKASAIGSASVEEIDRINIYHAAHLAMVRAVEGLADGRENQPEFVLGHILVDGNALPKTLKISATAVVKGDLKCLSIACASVIAKVWRDDLMLELDSRHPGYELAGHKGYGTPAHLRALQSLGPSPIHRRSFGPVAQAVKQMGGELPVPTSNQSQFEF